MTKGEGDGDRNGEGEGEDDGGSTSTACAACAEFEFTAFNACWRCVIGVTLEFIEMLSRCHEGLIELLNRLMRNRIFF